MKDEMKEPRFQTPDPATIRGEEAAMPHTPSPADAEPVSAIEAVCRRHEKQLAAIDCVTGVAIGRTAIGEPAIVVYLREAAANERIPSELEGFPVQTIVTGAIDAS
jgi:hypothetical protein